MMDHQNIARVLDAGTTASGRPYFVMELVHGVPITTFCDNNHLTPRQRLELFIPVCHAIQHAHQKGIIHRDIKPSNVLVTMYDDKPVPKVIDFGVAKAVEQRLTEKTLFTQFGALVGTFEYMSPEQAEMNAFGVDTRSDIYALGVLLYELLTGTTPLDRERVRQTAMHELVRLIKEEEAQQPSARLSSSQTLDKIAASRSTEPTRIAQLVKGDIDWIVMKCLEKDRRRRYETASALARDIERHLGDEPLEAGPPSAAYRLRKFVKRNRGPVLAASVVLLAMFLGGGGTTWGWIEALNQRDDAIQARKDEADQRKTAVNAISDARDAEAAKAKAEEWARIASQAEGKAIAKARDAETARAGDAQRKVRLVETRLALERGINACERDQVVEGLLWLARGLEGVPDDEPDLRLSLRRLLDAWSREIHTLKQYIPLTGSLMAVNHDRKIFVEAFRQADKGEWRNIVRLRDLNTGRMLGESIPIVAAPQFAIFSPGGKFFAIASLEQSSCTHVIQLFDVATRRPVNEPIRLRSPTLELLEFSPNGKRLVTLDGLNTNSRVNLWDVLSGKLIAFLPAEHARTIAFSPDGKTLLTAGGRHGKPPYELRLWDADTGKPVEKPLASKFMANSVTFTPDGKNFAIGGYGVNWPDDGFIELVDFATCKQIYLAEFRHGVRGSISPRITRRSWFRTLITKSE